VPLRINTGDFLSLSGHFLSNGSAVGIKYCDVYIMNSEISHKIKNRANPNDIFITPLKLSKYAIDMIDYDTNDIWYDPFKNNGSYYNQYPIECEKKYSEILENKDFFDFNENVTIICSNPPYSILDTVIEKSISLKPRIIQYLIGVNNLTARRIQMFEKHNYGLVKIHLCKVFKWYGMSVIVQFEKDKESILTYDRIVWK
tara:strand:+ start:1220 stop:1819 length:600 start_codon:yes stop_codon:yes gene_type:complete